VSAIPSSTLATKMARGHYAFVELLEQLYKERDLVPYPGGTAVPLKQEEILVVCRGVVQLFTIQQDGSETSTGVSGAFNADWVVANHG
jgi:hypothetical protein